jgi:deoxyribonuclease V
MDFPYLHSWKMSPKDAVVLQKRLAAEVVLEDSIPDQPKWVAGVDVSYRRQGATFHAAVVVLDFHDMSVIEQSTATGQVDFPYIPGLLSFRELPILLDAFRQLTIVPDAVLVDGQGRAHPRRFGLACHLGLWLDLPTIGCAKTRLCGTAVQPGEKRGAWVPLVDGEEEIGRVVRTRDRVRPLYVSPGHKVDGRKAVEIVLACGRGYRLPEPTRQAHLCSNRVRLDLDTRRPR